MTQIILLDPRASPEHLGFLPQMISESDPRPAREQFNDGYAHGGGWHPIRGFTLDDTVLKYPRDPPLRPYAMTVLGSELILFYEHDLVCIIQDDGTFEVARMD